MRINSYIGIFAICRIFINIGIRKFRTGCFIDKRSCRCTLYRSSTCTANTNCYIDNLGIVFCFSIDFTIVNSGNISIFNFCYRLLRIIFVCRSTADFRIGYASAYRCCTGCAYRADNGKNVRIVQGVCTYSFSVINDCAINNSAACAVRLRYSNIAAYSSRTGRAYTCCNIIAVAAVFCIGAYGNAFGFFLVTFIKSCIGNICFGAVIKPDVAQRCANASFACTGNLPGNRNNLRCVDSFCQRCLCVNNRICNISFCSVFYIIPCYTANAAALTCRCNTTRNSNNIAVAASFGVKFFRSNLGIFNICRIIIFNIRNSNSRPTGAFAGCSCKAARNGNNTDAAIFI